MWADRLLGRRVGRRRRVFLACAGAVLIAAVAAVVAVRSGGSGPVDGAGAPAPRASVAPSASGPAGGQASGGPVDADDDAETDLSLAGLTPTTVRYTFNAGPGRTVLDSSGHHPLRQVTGGGGSVAIVPRGTGYALRFPARCRGAAQACPRAILESTEPHMFNSGTRPIRFGASVMMTRADTGAGANVLQKGFSVGGGSQFKLQVDGRAGRPSCVLASGRGIYRLIGPVSVADGRWHAVACTRIGGRMSINVDGRAVSRRVPAALSIRNSEPLRIGGKSVLPGNDQFAGRIDDVFVALY